MPISENEARQAVIALGTAMMEDDKEARETVYSDYTEEDLKRVIRWAMRQLISQFAFLSHMQGEDYKKAWADMALAFSLSLPAEEGDEL